MAKWSLVTTVFDSPAYRVEKWLRHSAIHPLAVGTFKMGRGFDGNWNEVPTLL